jgi:hypothetical protein
VLTVDVPIPDDETTREADVANWHAFCVAYYEPIRRILRLLHVPEAEVGERAHAFLIKAEEKRFLDTFRAFQKREAGAVRRARFRTYLYRSLQYSVYDEHRRQPSQEPVRGMDLDETEARPEGVVPAADPDALYALDILHQALQALRRHCERTGKPHYWVYFEETLLADEFRGRHRKTRAELLEQVPGHDPQYLDNALTTAKRAFRRFVQEVIPRGFSDFDSPSARFQEWMEILRDSNASQFQVLHLAYRVAPFLSADTSETSSAALVVAEDAPDESSDRYEEPMLVCSDDEISILLSFRLELPLTQMLDPLELQAFIPRTSPLWPIHARSALPAQGASARHDRPGRPVCLMTLIEPTPAEANALARADLIGLLRRLKSHAKQLHHRPDHSVPEVVAQLIYTIVNVVALVRCGTSLHSIGAASLAGNVRWFLERLWLDDRLRPLLLDGLTRLQSYAESETR